MRTILLLAALAVAGCGDDTTSTTSSVDMSSGCNVPITCPAGGHVVCFGGRNMCEGPPPDMAHASD